MNNECIFSPDRIYRYSLIHQLDEANPSDKLMFWVALNPSTADEIQLDNTLKRIRGFTAREGYGGFIMGNIFAFRATLPKDMYAAKDAIGPDNDKWLLENAKRCGKVVAAWGGHGDYLDRGLIVAKLLKDFNPVCLKTNSDGSPAHPLYLKKDLPFIPYKHPKL
jgi:hypothetical protein